MTALDLPRLKNLLAKATPGEWIVNGPAGEDCGPPIYWIEPPDDDSNEATIATLDTGEHDNEANADLIAASHNALPALIAAAEERDALRKRVEVLERFARLAGDYINSINRDGETDMFPELSAAYHALQEKP